MKLKIASIVIPPRMRKDYGDLEGLAESLAAYGQIQDILIDQDNNLVAGGRRLAAAKLLGWTEIGVKYREALTPDEAKVLELEENVRRKDMTWQERTLAIADIHDLKSRNAALNHEKWGMRETGEMFGLALCSVGYATQVAKYLRQNDKEICEADSVKAALQILMLRKEDEAKKILAKQVVKSSTAVINTPTGSQEVIRPAVMLPSGDSVSFSLSTMLHNMDCLAFMDLLSTESIDHIVSDPPYGIDMAHLNQQNPHGGQANIERVTAEHTVDGNERLFAEMLPRMFRILKPNGFCVLWCDIMQWQRLYDLGISAGFRVQRWPITWCKLSRCMNQSAQYNFTKTTEIAIVMRKPSATLVGPQGSCFVLAENPTSERGDSDHPFWKPRAIWNFITSAIAIPGQVVFDPFAGEGSSIVSFIEQGLSPLACEVNPNHYSRLVENTRKTFLSKFPNAKFE